MCFNFRTLLFIITDGCIGNTYLDVIDNSFINCINNNEYKEFEHFETINNETTYFGKLFNYSVLKNSKFQKKIEWEECKMLDIVRIRNNPKEIEDALRKRMDNISLDEVLMWDEEKKKIGTERDELKNQKILFQKNSYFKKENVNVNKELEEIELLGDKNFNT